MKKKFKLKLVKDDVEFLEGVVKRRTEKAVRVERARYMLDNFHGESIYRIAKNNKTNRPKVQRVLHKAAEYGVKIALNDLPRSGRKKVITEEARLWLLNIACRKPKDFGLSCEIWTMNELAKYIRGHAKKAGWECLSKIGKGTVYKVLDESNVKPHKVRYYQERRDADFESKMAKVLCVYKEVALLKEKHKGKVVIVSYDEKPGIQAIGNVGDDLPAEAGKRKTILRDSHYKRHGTLSFIGGIDLLTGDIHAIVKDRHRSKEFIEFLKYVDKVYPQEIKIKMILDNHSAHISKETQAYLKSRSGRFEFVFTPKHGSWLNIIEVFFSKMARTLLRHIRVESKKELKERILKYIKELNKEPVIFRWKYKLSEI